MAIDDAPKVSIHNYRVAFNPIQFVIDREIVKVRASTFAVNDIADA